MLMYVLLPIVQWFLSICTNDAISQKINPKDSQILGLKRTRSKQGTHIWLVPESILETRWKASPVIYCLKSKVESNLWRPDGLFCCSRCGLVYRWKGSISRYLPYFRQSCWWKSLINYAAVDRDGTC